MPSGLACRAPQQTRHLLLETVVQRFAFLRRDVRCRRFRFGRARGTFFFGLPGNPASTMVTFEIFARAALELVGGQTETSLTMPCARLTREFRHRAGLTRFLPARLSADGAEITPVEGHGSGDIPALTRANAFLVADPAREMYAAGEWIRVLLK